MLPVAVAFVGYSLLNIAQAIQKMGLSALDTSKRRGWSIWAGGTLLTSVAGVVILLAVSIGRVSVVGAMAGSGLATLAIFSHFALGEHVGARETVGVAVILAAAALIGLFGIETAPTHIGVVALFVLFGSFAALFALLTVAFRRRPHVLGAVLGGYGGAMGGFIPPFQKVSTSAVGRESAFFDASAIGATGFMETVVSVVANPFAVVWLLLGLVSMVILQFGFRKGDAIRVVPAFSAMSIATPVIVGLVSFGERLHALQVVGIGAILVGVLLITLEPKAASMVESGHHSESSK
jgi:uncharacterized membrane protein